MGTERNLDWIFSISDLNINSYKLEYACSLYLKILDGTDTGRTATVTITVVTVWFVDLNASGIANGTSWADALAHPQDGIDLANPGDQVWVAAGNYVWVAGFQVLLLSSDVAVYGGFDGTESCLEQRDYTNNVTTLNGDTDGNGTGDVSRVVQIPWTVTNSRLDGFTITKGNANGAGVDGRGGGLLTQGLTNVTLANLIVTDNYGINGGGINDEQSDSTPVFENVVFSNNTSPNGGAVYLWNASAPTFNGVTFLENSTSGPIITNAVLWGNLATTDPEISDTGTSSPAVTYCNVQGSYPGIGNIDADPLFADPDGADDIVGTVDDDLTPSAGSPLIDAGDGSVAPATDIDNNGRVDDTGIPNTGAGTPDFTDIGAYEFQP